GADLAFGRATPALAHGDGLAHEVDDRACVAVARQPTALVGVGAEQIDAMAAALIVLLLPAAEFTGVALLLGHRSRCQRGPLSCVGGPRRCEAGTQHGTDADCDDQ